MAPVEISRSPSLLPASIVSLHALSVCFLVTLVARTAIRSYYALPPSSATRQRQPARRGHVQMFSVLAIMSLGVSLVFGWRFGSLSYRVWATERGVDLPTSIFGDRGALRGGEHPGRLHLVQWLNDTPFYQDLLEIVAEKARFFWWGQQVTLGAVSWSSFVALEGQRRNIAHLWAYLALAQLVNLSFAQNLFFLTLLLTPIPLPENVREITNSSMHAGSNRFTQLLAKIKPARPDGWVMSPTLQLTILGASYSAVFLVPFASNTPSFMSITLISKALLFAPLIVPYIVPQSFGTTLKHPHEAYPTYSLITRTTAILSGLLHLKASALAISTTIPENHYHRHSLLHPFKLEHRSALDRSTTAIGRVFSAVGEHPAVAAAGWDVLLSGLSLGIWAAVRGLDASKILGSMIPSSSPIDALRESFGSREGRVEEDEFVKSDPEPPTLRRRGGRTKKTDEAATPSTSSRKRTPKNATPNEDDATYHPPASTSNDLEEGDEDPATEDWEVAALAWGLVSIGGLGAGTAGVVGAEMMAR